VLLIAVVAVLPAAVVCNTTRFGAHAARFAALEARATTKGFLYVAAGPLVRSSYKASEFYIAGMLRQRRDLEAARNASQPAKETE